MNRQNIKELQNIAKECDYQQLQDIKCRRELRGIIIGLLCSQFWVMRHLRYIYFLTARIFR